MTSVKPSTPMYASIKSYIRSKIEARELRPGDAVVSENQMAAQFSVSRMTARRAYQELTDEGLLVRTPGLGTFVADARPVSSIQQINDISEEITARGHRHSSRIISLEKMSVPTEIALQLRSKDGAEALQSKLVHFENDTPIQLEQRFVDPRLVPKYLEQNFTQFTPSHYLMEVAPLAEAESLIEAILPTREVVELLGIEPTEPCLRVLRRTWSEGEIVCITILTHPGSRYRLGSHLFF